MKIDMTRISDTTRTLFH